MHTDAVNKCMLLIISCLLFLCFSLPIPLACWSSHFPGCRAQWNTSAPDRGRSSLQSNMDKLSMQIFVGFGDWIDILTGGCSAYFWKLHNLLQIYSPYILIYKCFYHQTAAILPGKLTGRKVGHSRQRYKYLLYDKPASRTSKMFSIVLFWIFFVSRITVTAAPTAQNGETWHVLDSIWAAKMTAAMYGANHAQSQKHRFV